MIDETYIQWKNNPTSENLGKLLQELEPVLYNEVKKYSMHDYASPVIMMAHAKNLAINAIYRYNPTKGTKLTSWVVSQLQPLSRISLKMRPVQVPELAYRQLAEINKKERDLMSELGRLPSIEELADYTGLSVNRLKKLKAKTVALSSESAIVSNNADSSEDSNIVAISTFTSDPSGYIFDAVYNSLNNERDKFIFKAKTGYKGTPRLQNKEIATRLGVSPAFITQRSNEITKMIQDMYSIEEQK